MAILKVEFNRLFKKLYSNLFLKQKTKRKIQHDFYRHLYGESHVHKTHSEINRKFNKKVSQINKICYLQISTINKHRSNAEKAKEIIVYGYRTKQSKHITRYTKDAPIQFTYTRTNANHTLYLLDLNTVLFISSLL